MHWKKRLEEKRIAAGEIEVPPKGEPTVLPPKKAKAKAAEAD